MKILKYNPQNGHEVTTSIRYFVSVSLVTVSEVNIVSYLLFANQSNYV